MDDVFLSYSRKDKTSALRLHALLQQHNRKAWVDWESIPATADWLAEVYAGIEQAQGFLFLLSPDSCASEVCGMEIAHAVKHNKRLIPVVCRAVPPDQVPEPLRCLNWIFFREEDDGEASLGTLLNALDTDLERVRYHTRLLARTQEWQDKKRNPSLLLRGSELAEAESWLRHARDYADVKPTEDQTEYVLSSRQSETRRQRGLLTVATVILCFSVCLSVFALLQRQDAVFSANAEKLSENRANGLAQKEREKAILAQEQTVRAQEAEKRAKDNLELATASKQKAVRSEQKAVASAKDARWQEHLAKISEQSATTNAQKARIEKQNALREKQKAVTNEKYAIAQRQRAERLLYPYTITRVQKGLAEINGAEPKTWLDQYADLGKTGTDVRGFEWRYLAAQCRDASAYTVTGHQNSISAVACSPDGRLIASGAEENVICLWNAQTGEPAGHVTLNTPRTRCLLFLDADTLAIGTTGQTLVWDVKANRELVSLPAPGEVTSLAHSKQANLLACGLDGGAILLWDRNTWQKLATLKEKSSGAVNSLAFDPEGKQLASGYGDYDGSNATKLWDCATRHVSDTLGVPRSGNNGWGRVNSVAFSPDGKYLATGGEDQTARVWKLATHKFVEIHSHANNVTYVAFSSDGKWLATGSDDSTIKIWDMTSLSEDGRPQGIVTLHGHRKGIRALAFVPNSHTLVSGSLDTTLKTWDIDRSRRPSFKAHTGIVGTICYSKNGDLLASGSFKGDNQVCVQDAHTLKTLYRTPPHRSGVYAAFSPDSQTLAVAGEDGTLTLFEAKTGKAKEVHLPNAQEPLDVVAFCPTNSNLLATGGRGTPPDGGKGHCVRLWDVAKGAEIKAFREKQQGHEGWVMSLAFSPDGKTLVSGGGSSGEMRWWDVGKMTELGPSPRQVDGRMVASQFAHRNNIFALAFSPNGKWLATGSEDNTAQLWDVATRKPIHLMTGFGDIVYSVAFSPDGKTLATACKSGAVKLWVLSTLQDNLLQDAVTLLGDRGSAYSAAFAPNGNTLAVGYMRGDFVLWQADGLAQTRAHAAPLPIARSAPLSRRSEKQKRFAANYRPR